MHTAMTVPYTTGMNVYRIFYVELQQKKQRYPTAVDYTTRNLPGVLILALLFQTLVQFLLQTGFASGLQTSGKTILFKNSLSCEKINIFF